MNGLKYSVKYNGSARNEKQITMYVRCPGWNDLQWTCMRNLRKTIIRGQHFKYCFISGNPLVICVSIG